LRLSDRTVRFGAVGDLTFGDHPLCVGFGAHSRFRREEPLFPFRRSLEALQRSELLFGNLECTHSSIGLRRWNYQSVQMRGEPRMIEGLRGAGFKVLNVANNHSVQHGVSAFADTISMLEHAGIQCCGLAADAFALHAKPVVVAQNGLRVGFLGYSLRPRQYFEHIPPYAEGEPDAMVRDVEELRPKVDAVVVSVHWGDEFIQEPSPSEIRLAHRLADAGATLVIGHHPHALRGMERHGAAQIVYSLGNFVCDMAWDESLRTSMIFECLLTTEGAQDVRLVPVYINDDHQPEVLSGAAGAAVLDHVEQLSRRLADATPSAEQITERNYEASAELSLRDIRAKSQRFFISRLSKYPPPLLAQQLVTYFTNRLRERFSGG
jgi:poly-gamma-glutamate synthesis protein (capsule biosynthesis protein)